MGSRARELLFSLGGHGASLLESIRGSHRGDERLARAVAGAPPRPLEDLGGASVEAANRVNDMIRRGDGRGHINSERLIVFNMGLGKDSMAMLALLAEGRLQAEGYTLRPQDIDAVVFSDPGMEWEQTYKARKDVDRLLKKINRGIRNPSDKLKFYTLEKPPMAAWKQFLSSLEKARRQGKASRKQIEAMRHQAWRARLEGRPIADKASGGYYHIYPPIAEAYSRGRPKPYRIRFGDTACTDAHKVEPIRKFMTDLAKEKFGPSYTPTSWTAKVKRGDAVPHLNLLGIAKGEGGPAAPRALYAHPYDPDRVEQYEELDEMRWERQGEGRSTTKLEKKIAFLRKGGNWAYTEAYPLVELGISKEDETPILKRHRLSHITKSGCVLCHSQPPKWWWALGQFAETEDWARDKLDRIVEYQRLSVDSGGGPVLRDAKYNRNPDGSVRKGRDRRTIRQIIPIIYDLEVRPMVQRHMRRGKSQTEAKRLVVEQILRKDYVQGCKVGDANRTSDIAPLCPGHGGEDG